MVEDMNPKPNVYAVILAGGGGTRLWPLSRTPGMHSLIGLRLRNGEVWC